MFGFLKRKRKVTPIAGVKSRVRYAPNTKIRYDRNLITVFKDDHKKLLEIYQRIDIAYGNNDSVVIRRLLRQFKNLLTGHLLRENVSLYAYLKYNLSDDPINLELMQSMQREMGEIGRVVFRFLKKATDQSARYNEAFKKDFDDIGAALVTRIQNEERVLYPIYGEPNSSREPSY